jgi:hypothetical protein
VRRCWQLASLDEDAVNGAAKEMPCAIPNILVDYVRDEPPGLTTGGAASDPRNSFVVESFIVIVHRYKQWRQDVLNHLCGILGLAIWERFEQLSPKPKINIRSMDIAKLKN